MPFSAAMQNSNTVQKYQTEQLLGGRLNNTEEKSTIIIKRYQNRKLYDTQNSTYVTLEDIGFMVRKGSDVRIIDNKTKEDLTSVTLTQIIFEEEKRKKSLLPLHALKNIIRNGGGAIKDLVLKTTDSVQHTIHSAKDSAESMVDKLGHAITPENDNIIKDVLERTHSFSKNIEDKIKDTVDSITHIKQLQTEVRKLRQRCLYLEKKLRTYEKR